MQKRSVLIVCLLVVLISGGAARPTLAAPSPVSRADVIPPTINAIDPASGYNDLGTPVTITGSGFLQDLTDPLNPIQPSASLGTTALTDVTWVDTGTLTATVPWGMDPGTYDLTFTNPDGGSASLSGAYTVKAGIGQWNGSSLYGGNAKNLLLKPGDPNTIYLLISDVALFRSRDAGMHWTYIYNDVLGNPTFAVDPFHPSWLYINGNHGIYLSKDEGDTWAKGRSTWADGRNMGDNSNRAQVFPSPFDPQVMFIADMAIPGHPIQGVLGLMKSTDGGTSWRDIPSLDGISVQTVAYHPTDPKIMALGTQDGRLFRTQDGGDTWSEVPGSPVDDVGLVEFNPYQPSELWVSKDEACGLFKSTDATLTDWQNVTPPDLQGGYKCLWFVDFTAADSVYTWRHHSSDGGLHWESFQPDGSWGLVFDPGNPLVAYSADDQWGMQATTDGGLTWQVRDQGLTGMVAMQFVVSPTDPLRIYAVFSAGGNGIYLSNDGGLNWSFHPLPDSFCIRVVRLDPFNPQHIYVAADAGFYYSPDDGESWVNKGWNLSPMVGENAIDMMAVDPFQPGHMLMDIRTGMDAFNNILYGQLYSSSDYGDTWTAVTLMTDQRESGARDIVFDPQIAGLVYLTSDHAGFYRSTDHGATWQRTDDPNRYFMQWLRNITIATHPQKTVLATVGDHPALSFDNGFNWIETSGLSGNGPSIFLYLNGDSTRLYGGDISGLYFSSNGGNSWARAAGTLGSLETTALGYGTGPGYTILYAATLGGMTNPASNSSQDRNVLSQAVSNVVVKPGIYRFVTQKNAGKPGVPALISPANNALQLTTQPALDWKDATNADHYDLQISTDKSFGTTQLDRSDIKDSKFNVPTDLTRNRKYYWRVRTYNSKGNASKWSTVRSFRIALPPPDKLKVDASIQNLRPTFTWDLHAYNPPPYPTGYTIQISKTADFKKLVKSVTTTGNLQRTALVSDLPPKTKLYWRIRTNGANGPSDWATAPGSFTTDNPPSIPKLLSPANKARVPGLNPTLDWSDSNGAPLPLTYWVEYANHPDFSDATSISSAVSQSNFQADLSSASTYYWHVRACNASSKCSDWSSVRSFKTP